MDDQPAVATAPTLDELRMALTAWMRGAWWIACDLPQRLVITEQAFTPGYRYELVSQYQTRAVAARRVPYKGEPLVPGPACDPWDVPNGEIQPFQEKTVVVVMPGTETVFTCPDCGGEGRVTCPSCHGSREVNCPAIGCTFGRCNQCSGGHKTCTWCGGSGRRSCSSCGGSGTRTRFENGESKTESCSFCNGGQTICTSCSGSGRVTCSNCNGSGICPRCHGRGKVDCSRCTDGTVVCDTCAGYGKLKQYDELTVTIFNRTLEQVHAPLEISPGLVEKAAHVEAKSQTAPSLAPDAVTITPVTPILTALLQDAEVSSPDTRLLQQRLTAFTVPVTRVDYRYEARPPARLWMYGADTRIHAPHAPLDAGRICLVAAAVIALLALIAYQAWWYLR